MSNFDEAARTWDENPIHMERSVAIAEKMIGQLDLSNGMEALEYGAGTGILSFLLHDRLKHITMMDSSEGMVTVMKEKIVARKVENVVALRCDLEKEQLDEKFDLIFNQMVLHHIKDVQGIFSVFFGMLRSGGSLAIADLYAEDGSFHGAGVDVHLGFDPKDLEKQLITAGFTSVRHEICYTVVRPQAVGKPLTYPIFLLTATKE